LNRPDINLNKQVCDEINSRADVYVASFFNSYSSYVYSLSIK
jgi:hypothetical protein